MPPECIEELRANEKHLLHGLLVSETDGSDPNKFIEIQRFSNINRLIGTLTQVLKFCSVLRERIGFTTSFNGKERNSA